MLDRQGEVANLASLLRVSCLHWISNMELHAREHAQDPAAQARLSEVCVN